MTKREINRNKIQDYAVYLSTKFRHVVLCWATGCGKSLAAIKIIHNDIQTSTQEKGEWNRWYIVVAERQHISNWEEDIRKHGYEYLLDLGYIEIFCYNSLHKYTNRAANIVLDEAHSVTDLRMECLITIKFDKLISLSATLEPLRERQLSLLSTFHKYTIDTDKAIKAELLPPPTIVKVPVKLTPSQQRAYNELTSNISRKQQEIEDKQAFINNIIRVFPESPKIRALKEELMVMDNDLLKLRVRRKALISSGKTTSVKKLQRLMETWKKRYVIFTGSLSQNNQLGRQSYFNGPIDISSSNTLKINEKRIADFNSGITNGLVCYKMLRQGTNLNNIHMGVITQLDSKQLSFIQMMGRIFRSTSPVLFVFVAENTIDETYWKECSEGLDPSYMTTYEQYMTRIN